MTPSKLNVMFSWFPYGGNGACASEHPNLRSWLADTYLRIRQDQRIDQIFSRDFSDTPIPMMRNRAVVEARELGADVLVMMDSDQHPDLYLGGEADAVPFFDSSFDFLYKRKVQGIPTVVGAPYCGPPPGECVYVFRWANDESDNPNVDHHLEMYPREEAAIMSGIQPCAALPTGCIMFDMSIFEITDPKHEYQDLLKRYADRKVAELLTKSWFYYEYSDIYQSKKASTEDVTATRDMVLCTIARTGHNPMFAQWSSWAGHWKPKCVGKPVSLSSDSINSKYATAVMSGKKSHHTMSDITTMNAGKKVLPVQVSRNQTPVNDTILEAA